MKRVVFVTFVIHKYRVRFHELVAEILRRNDVHYEVVTGRPERCRRDSNDTIVPGWATEIPNRVIRIGHRWAVW